jgi:hypothetical protein
MTGHPLAILARAMLGGAELHWFNRPRRSAQALVVTQKNPPLLIERTRIK